MRWYWIAVLVVVPLAALGYGIHVVTRPVVPTIGVPVDQVAPQPAPVVAGPVAAATHLPTDAEKLAEVQRQFSAQQAEVARLREQNAQQQAADAAAAQARAGIRRRIYGSAWLSRNNGSSDLMRGLHVEILPATLPQAVAVASLTGVADEWGAWVKTTRNQLADELQKDAEDKRNDYPTHVYENAAADTRKSLDEYERGLKSAQQAASTVPPSGQDCSANFNQAKSLSHFAPFAFAGAVKRVALNTTTTDADGKYSIDPQPPGFYYLHARIDTPAMFVEWVVPVTIGPDADAKVDLFNDNALVLSKG